MSDGPVEEACEVVAVEGADATSLTDSQLSQALAPLEVGAACWSLLLEPDGTFGDWVRVARESEDRWIVLGAPGRAAAIAERLGRFKLRERAAISTQWRSVSLTSEGRGAEGIELPVLWAGPGETEVLGGGAVAPGEPDAPSPLDRRRVSFGRLGPADLRPGDNPFAIGAELLSDAVSFTKGCYTGQELVARMDSRSATAPRRLVLATSERAAAVGEPLMLDGREVGEVRSVSGGPRAICIVARSVPVPSDGEVTVGGVPVALRQAAGSR